MLWSLLKIVLFIAVVAGLAMGALWLLQAQGALQIAFGGYSVTLGPLQTVIAAGLLVVAVWIGLKILGLVWALVKFLNGDETAFTRWRSRAREQKGMEALEEAVLALASGEGAEAQEKAERAQKYLDRPQLTNMLIAQGAEMNGDRRKAQEVYKRLLSDDRTRFAGVRGLLHHKLAENDTATAMALAEKAFALRPSNDEAQDTLLRLQAARHDWTGARQTLGAKLKHGTLPRDVHKRRDAVLALSEAHEVLDTDSPVHVREAAIEANRLSPDLIPAATLAARSYVENGQKRKATRVLKKAWEVRPHPDLAAAFAEIEPEESPVERVHRFETLTRMHPDHPETRMLKAELNIAAEDFPAARRALGDLATSDPTTRSVAIMAAIERGEGADDSVVRGWLTRALTARRGPQWVCENCHTVHADWHAVCESCGAFDTLAWTEPPQSSSGLPGRGEMLPLIVGDRKAAGPEPEPEAQSEVETPKGEVEIDPPEDGAPATGSAAKSDDKATTT